MTAERYIPGEQFKVSTLKERFANLNRLVTLAGGWIVSIPGDPRVRLEQLEGSSLRGELEQLGYKLTDEGTGERIVPDSIVERGLIGGSTVAATWRHAGICKIEQFSLTLRSS